MIKHVVDSIDRAVRHQSNLNNTVLSIYGMSSQKVRHLLNNIVSMNDARYMEVGVWQGSTFISALYRNAPLSAIAIDDFHEKWGVANPQQLFNNNCKKFISCPYALLCQDFVNVNLASLPPANIYFYDGAHDQTKQYLGLQKFYPILDQQFIFIVDDYNMIEAKIGTQNAIKDLSLTIQYETVLSSDGKNMNKQLWWNGLYVCVLSK